MEYLNEFHKESTERCLKSIAEMKKTPTNYEEEYARHRMMLKQDMEQEKKEIEEKQLQRCNLYANSRIENQLDEHTKAFIRWLIREGLI